MRRHANFTQQSRGGTGGVDGDVFAVHLINGIAQKAQSFKVVTREFGFVIGNLEEFDGARIVGLVQVMTKTRQVLACLADGGNDF